jgi:ribosomal protein S27E
MEQNVNIIAFPERRHGVRIGDLRSWHYLRVTCRFCGHAGRIYAQSLWRRCSMNDRVVDVMTRVRCRHCGGSGAAIWDIWQIDRNA